MLRKVLADINRLATIVDSSIQSDEFTAIDKDLVKEKLRALYEDVLFIDCYDSSDDRVIYFDEDEDIEPQLTLENNDTREDSVDIIPMGSDDDDYDDIDTSSEIASFDTEDGEATVDIVELEEQEDDYLVQDESTSEIASFDTEDGEVTIDIVELEEQEDEYLVQNESTSEIASFDTEDGEATIDIVELEEQEDEYLVREESTSEIASFDTEDGEATVDIVELEEQEDDYLMQDESTSEIASFDTEDGEATVDIVELEEQEDDYLMHENIDEDNDLDIELDEPIILDDSVFGEAVQDYSLDSSNNTSNPQASSTVNQPADTATGLESFISAADRQRIVGTIFGGDTQLYKSLMNKLDSADDFEGAVLELQYSNIDHSSQDMAVLVEALERRFI